MEGVFLWADEPMNIRGRQFGEVLLEAVDESLSVLGDEPKQAIYQYLMTMHSIQREEILDKLEEFAAGLKQALGGASAVMERLILKKLFQRLGSTFRESQGLDFHDYVDDAKRRFETLRQRHVAQDEFEEHGKSKKGQVPS